MFCAKIPAIIVDLDGTLCDITHRIHFIEGEGKKNWDAFNAAMHKDAPKHNIIDLVNTFFHHNHQILLVTGRFEKYSMPTVRWLAEHGVKWNALYMRKDGDFRSDHITKEEHLEVIRQKFDVRFVLEDRDKVVEMWRKNGLTCLQVQKGDY